MTLRITRTAAAIGLALAASAALAESHEVTVTIENLAPTNGTNQTPHWVGFHDGTFDIYDGGTPASSLPEAGSVAVERLAEDGNNDPIAEVFSRLQPNGTDATIAGPNGPIAPGDVATMSFTLDSTSPANRYFSYASMVLPSNDFWYANGNPRAIEVFDEHGRFVAADFIVTRNDVLDAGTEVNDEIPENTAFFGQTVADAGTSENGVILDFGDPSGLVAFRAPDDGGNILADERFAMADFTLEGYPLVKISFSAERLVEVEPDPVIEGPALFRVRLGGDQEVPPVHTRARGVGRYILSRDGQSIRFFNGFRRLDNVVMAHLHLGAAGENGPVVVNLLPADFDADDPKQARRASRFIRGEITADDLVGPLEGRDLGALTRAMLDGEVYVNVHTVQNPAGEIRGQVETLRAPRRH